MQDAEPTPIHHPVTEADGSPPRGKDCQKACPEQAVPCRHCPSPRQALRVQELENGPSGEFDLSWQSQALSQEPFGSELAARRRISR